MEESEPRSSTNEKVKLLDFRPNGFTGTGLCGNRFRVMVHDAANTSSSPSLLIACQTRMDQPDDNVYILTYQYDYYASDRTRVDNCFNCLICMSEEVRNLSSARLSALIKKHKRDKKLGSKTRSKSRSKLRVNINMVLGKEQRL